MALVSFFFGIFMLAAAAKLLKDFVSAFAPDPIKGPRSPARPQPSVGQESRAHAD